MAGRTDATERRVGERQLAERRLLAALRRFHHREPLSQDLRVDQLLALLREPARRPASHRGARALTLDDAALRSVIDELVERGEIEREGRRVRLAGRHPLLEGEPRRAADALLAELDAAGASPPRAEMIARRLGVAAWIVAALRSGGELVSLATGIDYSRSTLDRLLARLREAQVSSVAEARDELGTTRRYAAALLAALDERGASAG
ncbi:MAG TPA: SelB C-terminal domain-containing protein [Candidatus Limnocylindria bacterium]|jgi:hypothetical protein|nr:SelB C-terminal domain-containing protein [Candidatus Limnocylindria bacterium]